LTKVNGSITAAIYADYRDFQPEGHNMNRTQEQLLARKEELVQRLKAIRTDLARGLAADSKEQALQLENMDVLQEIHRLADEELRAVERELAALSGKV
jgi:hypothetical protein